MTTMKTALERMVTLQRAERVARRLFPHDVADGTDCRAETGREGEPCGICAGRNEAWAKLVAEVRAVMIEAFS